MSEIIERDHKGRFLSGTKPGPGRRVGSRNKLSTDFLLDLHDAWRKFGPAALANCAEQKPDAFCRIIADLLPRSIDLNLDVTASAVGFAQTFRQALAALHDQQRPEPKIIEHKVTNHGSKPGSR